MMNGQRPQIITTIKERCKICYTCIRECPAKAISVENGQAYVMQDRCIHCGNCVNVCGQSAKEVLSSSESVISLINNNSQKAAILAPSFPAHYDYISYEKLVGGLKALGFDYVVEVGVGAEIISNAYKNILSENPQNSYISSCCPGIVSYIEKYHKSLVSDIMPLVSPMVATGKLLKKNISNDLVITFIGPCVAKKYEQMTDNSFGVIDEVITFKELDEIFEKQKIILETATDSDFDGPAARNGTLFALSRGLLQCAHISEDLVAGDIVNADGKANFIPALKEYALSDEKPRLLDCLSCEGCIMGAGIKSASIYKKRSRVSKFVQERLKKDGPTIESLNWKNLAEGELTAHFKPDEQIPISPKISDIESILVRLGKEKKEDQLNCGACGYESCVEHAVAIAKGYAESAMCLPHTIDQLNTTVVDLQNSYEELRSIKETLNHRERLASMGQLSAGIAHEVNNPLGVILLYSDLLKEEVATHPKLKEDLDVIITQANRCKKIVSGLLNFSRQNRVVKVETDLEKLIQVCIDLVAIPKSIKVSLINDSKREFVLVDKDQLSQVFINIIQNGVDAMEGVTGNIAIKISDDHSDVKIEFIDEGGGIPSEIITRIFDPFFTTKMMGKGTGLGLPVSYGIVKMHGGQIKIESNTDKSKAKCGTKVLITLPVSEEFSDHSWEHSKGVSYGKSISS